MSYYKSLDSPQLISNHDKQDFLLYDSHRNFLKQQPQYQEQNSADFSKSSNHARELSYEDKTSSIRQEKAPSHSGSDPRKVFIGGIGRSTTKETIEQYFSRFGVVNSCEVIIDHRSGRSRRFGFVTYQDSESARAAVAGKHQIDKVMVECRHALSRMEARARASIDSFYNPNKIFVGGVPDLVAEDEFEQFFSTFGEIVDASLAYDRASHRLRGFGFVVFSTQEAANNAVGHHILRGKRIEAKKALPRQIIAKGSDPKMRHKDWVYSRMHSSSTLKQPALYQQFDPALMSYREKMNSDVSDHINTDSYYANPGQYTYQSYPILPPTKFTSPFSEASSVLNHSQILPKLHWFDSLELQKSQESSLKRLSSSSYNYSYSIPVMFPSRPSNVMLTTPVLNTMTESAVHTSELSQSDQGIDLNPDIKQIAHQPTSDALPVFDIVPSSSHLVVPQHSSRIGLDRSASSKTVTDENQQFNTSNASGHYIMNSGDTQYAYKPAGHDEEPLKLLESQGPTIVTYKPQFITSPAHVMSPQVLPYENVEVWPSHTYSPAQYFQTPCESPSTALNYLGSAGSSADFTCPPLHTANIAFVASPQTPTANPIQQQYMLDQSSLPYLHISPNYFGFSPSLNPQSSFAASPSLDLSVHGGPKINAPIDPPAYMYHVQPNQSSDDQMMVYWPQGPGTPHMHKQLSTVPPTQAKQTDQHARSNLSTMTTLGSDVEDSNRNASKDSQVLSQDRVTIAQPKVNKS